MEKMMKRERKMNGKDGEKRKKKEGEKKREKKKREKGKSDRSVGEVI